MRPSGTNTFQHFHASYASFSVRSHATVPNMQMSEWMSEWMSVWMSAWMYEWQSANLHNNSNRKVCICRAQSRVASGYEVTKSSCSRCTFHRQAERGKRWAAGEGGEGERNSSDTEPLHPQFSFNWLSPLAKMHEENGKWMQCGWKTGAGFQRANFIAKNENRWKLWNKKLQ